MMDFLRWLAGLGNRSDATAVQWRLEFQSLPQGGWAFLTFAAFFVAFFGALWLYRREGKMLTRFARLALATMRFLVLAGVLVMLLEPAIIFTKRETIPSRLLVLVDDSESVDFKDAFVNAGHAKKVADSLGLKSADELREQTRLKLAERALDRGLMQRQLRRCRPELKLVAATVAAMATIAADRHVDRERATMPWPGLVQRTTSVPLRARSSRGNKPKQIQDLLHRDEIADSVEVDAWHGCSSLGDTMDWCPFDRSVPSILSMGNGNDRPWTISQGASNHPACGRADRLVRATPTPRPIARS